MNKIKLKCSDRSNAEIKVRVPNAEFFAEKTADSFEEAVDTALMAIEKQITKSKEKSR